MLTNSNFYIGDSSVSRLYQGENLIWDASHPDILCEWISNGDASTNPDVYFNTFMNPDLTLKVETKYSYHNRNYSGGAALFGSRASATDSRYYLFTFAGLQIDGQSLYTAKFWFKNQEGYSATVPTLDEPHVITTCATYSSDSAATAVNCILDGSTTSRAVSISSALSNTHQMYMFAINNQGTVDYRCLADTRIYYMKIWRDNRLARFFVPVLHWLNGQYVPCFYDKVTDIYIYNLGTDTPTYKIQGDYLLDYLGAQPETAIPNNVHQSTRYETGLIANDKMAVDTRFRIVYGRENFIYGSATSRDTTPAWQSYSLGAAGNLTRIDSNHGGTTTSSVTFALTSDESTISNVHTFSTYFDDQARAIAYLDSSLFTKTVQSVNFSSETIQLLTRRGYDTVPDAGSGSRIYYINFTKSNVPAKTYIPVFHNNQAAFLDLNSGTYIYNIGTSAPYYQFKR